MALANTAVGLAQAGNKVLVVDFDLEAPGLDTFELLKPKGNPLGVVDFVYNYLEQNKAPEADKFIHRTKGMDKDIGPIWIMPSGRKKAYASRINHIDWINLYKNKEGYLLFEELKEQWKQKYKFDYVLIDSRTGHTDTSGICTRQLPNAVVILFFPNDQNLGGLTKVVKSINEESTRNLETKIKLHFVMSNVPYLDDEDQILIKIKENFVKKLQMKHPPMKIHRYDSLSLLNQEIFLASRPKSRLANEYQNLVSEIKKYNPSDYEGAILYLKETKKRMPVWDFEDDKETKERLKKIEDQHKNRGEVLYHLGDLYDFQGDSERALGLFDKAIDVGLHTPNIYFNRARLQENIGNRELAVKDLLTIFDFESVDFIWIIRAQHQLVRIGDFEPEKIIYSRTLKNLDKEKKLLLASNFNRSTMQSKIAVHIMQELLDSGEYLEDYAFKFNFGLSLMSLGKCNEAAENFKLVLQNKSEEIETIESLFNYAMANWGLSNDNIKTDFQKVVDRHEMLDEPRSNPNYLQCMTVAYWGIGDKEKSFSYLKKAQDKILDSRERSHFSCWRYLEVDKKQFREDLSEMEELLTGHSSLKPRYLKQQSSD